MIYYEEDWILQLLCRFKGSVALKASAFAVPAALGAVALQFLDAIDSELRQDYGLLDLDASTIWVATSAALVFLVTFRTNYSILRFWEGTTLLHQMRGEWFDTVSNCVTFTIFSRKDERKCKDVMKFRHALVRLMSLCHGNALEEISFNQFLLDTIDVLGLDKATLHHLKSCNELYNFNKVEVCLHLIQSLITQAFHDGIISVPPPILSRVYQTISRGFVNLLNAKKIADTRFPFPYTQITAFLLLINTALTPVLLTSAVENRILAVLLTFLAVFAFSAVNYVSIELDNPFGKDENDLPLYEFQRDMNSCLMMLLHPNADLIPQVRKEYISDFEDLMDKWQHGGDRASKIGTDGRLVRNRFDSHCLVVAATRTLASSADDESSEAL